MDWSNERYVRLYTRDSKTWLLLSWEGQTVLSMFLRKCDRCGIMSGAGDAVDLAVMFANGIPVEVVETGLARLLKHGVIESGKEGFFMPKFLEAQETSSSDAQRQRESREKRLAKTRVTGCDIRSQEDHDLSHGVTFSHRPSQVVTSGHNVSQPVTPSVPSVPSVPNCAIQSSSPDAADASPEPVAIEAVKVKKPRKASTGPMADLWNVYVEAIVNRYEVEPDHIGGQTARELKDILDGRTPEEASEIIRQYVELDDDFLIKTYHSLSFVKKRMVEIKRRIAGITQPSKHPEAAKLPTDMKPPERPPIPQRPKPEWMGN